MTPPNQANGSTSCKLELNHSALNDITTLALKSTTQVIEIKISINPGNGRRKFPNRKWVWANKIGRTIVSLIAQLNLEPAWYFSTLSCGTEKVNIAVFEESYGCLETVKDKGNDLVFDLLLRHLFSGAAKIFL